MNSSVWRRREFLITLCSSADQHHVRVVCLQVCQQLCAQQSVRLPQAFARCESVRCVCLRGGRTGRTPGCGGVRVWREGRASCRALAIAMVTAGLCVRRHGSAGVMFPQGSTARDFMVHPRPAHTEGFFSCRRRPQKKRTDGHTRCYRGGAIALVRFSAAPPPLDWRGSLTPRPAAQRPLIGKQNPALLDAIDDIKHQLDTERIQKCVGRSNMPPFLLLAAPLCMPSRQQIALHRYSLSPLDAAALFVGCVNPALSLIAMLSASPFSVSSARSFYFGSKAQIQLVVPTPVDLGMLISCICMSGERPSLRYSTFIPSLHLHLTPDGLPTV